MRIKLALACTAALAITTVTYAQGTATPAAAQSKLTAKMDCPKFEPSPVPVGDQPGHALAVGKTKCTYSAGEIAGVQIKEEEDTFAMDMTAARSGDRGYAVISLANGDKAFVQFQGTTMMKNNVPTGASGTWSFTGGTGKAKGLKGKGTYKGSYKADGSASFEITGDYEVAVAGGK
jgi:hypothetical protein